jgi:hypothetical protein
MSSMGHHHNRQKFTIPIPDTLYIYVVTEVQLLRWLIFAFTEPILDKEGHYVFNFDKPQIDAITGLIASLREREPLRTMAKWVVEVFHRLYFPSQPSRSVFNTFAEPVSAFLALQCLTTEGAPIPLEEIPPLCARLQFSMRLRGYHYLFTNYMATYVPAVETFGSVSHDFFIDP